MRLIRYTVFVVGLLQAVPAMAQSRVRSCWAQWEALGGPFRDLQRSFDLSDTHNGHPLAINRAGQSMVDQCRTSPDSSGSIEIRLLPATVLIQDNSDYPRPQQDGLRWAGRGMSSALTAGAAARWKFVSAALAPVATYQQNKEFAYTAVDATGLSQYGNYLNAGLIDLPQRFGPDSYWSYSLGQSFLRADAKGVSAGVSNENLSWGPAHQNPLVMSAAAPGFPHAFIGTSQPVRSPIGSFQAEAVWGRLKESDYFDFKTGDDKTLFAGLVGAFSPGDIGLTIGFARGYQRPITDSLSLADKIIGPYKHLGSNTEDNQVLSGFIHWVLPESGFEVYGEYARDDHWEDLRDVIQEPDHTRAYTVGFEKVITKQNSPNLLRIDAEATNLNRDPTYQGGRGRTVFYTNTSVVQGYTHRGQPLGAPIGPGSDAQYVSADYVGRTLLGGMSIQRIRYDDDAYYDRFGNRYTNRGHDAEVTLGVRGGAIVRNIQIIGELARSHRYNRDLNGLIDGTGITVDSNFSFTLGASLFPEVRIGH